jgi:hypothetical protein
MQVQSSSTPLPWVECTADNPAVGTVRIHRGQIEIYAPYGWQALALTMANINLTHDAEQALEWARRKMQEESELEERMKRYPGLKEAYDKFIVLDALTKQTE